MPYARPTLTQLRTQVRQDLVNAGIPGVDGFLRFGVLPALAEGQAGMSWLHYGYLDYIAKQATPFTATDEYLAAWGALKNVYLEAATIASSPAASWRASANSNPIPTGTVVTRSDGWIYVTTAPSTLSAGLASAPVTSMSAGAAGDALVGAVVTLGSPVAGVQTSGTLTQPATGGSDVQTQDEFRNVVLAAWQAQGIEGREQDYVEWALEVPGVTRAWVARNGFGAGTVVVYVMLDDAEAATGGFPVGSNGSAAGETRYVTATGDQLAVANAIYPNQPVTALVIVCAPTPQPQDFVVADLGAGNTPANKVAITNALNDMFLRLSAPGGTVHPNSWEAAIEAIPTVGTFNVVSPALPVTGATAGAMPVLGNLTCTS